MTNQQILTQAIQKAIDGGWKNAWPFVCEPYPGVGDAKARWFFGDSTPAEALLFNHAFAKALWGEDLVHGFKGNNLGQMYQFHRPSWQYHLQQMVVADDPIKYLGENLPK